RIPIARMPGRLAAFLERARFAMMLPREQAQVLASERIRFRTDGVGMRRSLPISAGKEALGQLQPVAPELLGALSLHLAVDQTGRELRSALIEPMALQPEAVGLGRLREEAEPPQEEGDVAVDFRLVVARTDAIEVRRHRFSASLAREAVHQILLRLPPEIGDLPLVGRNTFEIQIERPSERVARFRETIRSEMGPSELVQRD